MRLNKDGKESVQRKRVKVAQVRPGRQRTGQRAYDIIERFIGRATKKKLSGKKKKKKGKKRKHISSAQAASCAQENARISPCWTRYTRQSAFQRAQCRRYRTAKKKTKKGETQKQRRRGSCESCRRAQLFETVTEASNHLFRCFGEH